MNTYTITQSQYNELDKMLVKLSHQRNIPIEDCCTTKQEIFNVQIDDVLIKLLDFDPECVGGRPASELESYLNICLSSKGKTCLATGLYLVYANGIARLLKEFCGSKAMGQTELVLCEPIFNIPNIQIGSGVIFVGADGVVEATNYVVAQYPESNKAILLEMVNGMPKMVLEVPECVPEHHKL